MGTRLVSFLGTASYRKTTYTWRSKAIHTGHFAQAATRVAFEADEVLVLATDEAWEENGEALKAELGVQPTRVPIPWGRQDELWSVFVEVVRAMRCDSGRVILDITNGFRSQSFFAGSVLGYLREASPRDQETRVVYGAFEAKDERGYTPIWDLSAHLEVLEWSRALGSFLETGNGDAVARLTKTRGKQLALTWSRGARSDPAPTIARLGGAIEAFSADLVTLRTGSLLLGRRGARSTAEHLARSIEDVRGESGELAPLLGVLDRIAEEVAPLRWPDSGRPGALNDEWGHGALAALARLYLRMGRVAEAAATVREGWVTLYGGPGAEGIPCDHPARRQAEFRWRRAHPDAQTVCDYRNDIQHAGYSLDPKPANTLRRDLGSHLVEPFADCWPPPRPPEAEAPHGPVFANISNHPAAGWPAKQSAAAERMLDQHGRIEDIAFPVVGPELDEAEVDVIARGVLAKVPPAAVAAMVMGEYTLTVQLVRLLQERGVRCFAATTRREVEVTDDGSLRKSFHFTRFREYPRLAEESG